MNVELGFVRSVLIVEYTGDRVAREVGIDPSSQIDSIRDELDSVLNGNFVPLFVVRETNLGVVVATINNCELAYGSNLHGTTLYVGKVVTELSILVCLTIVDFVLDAEYFDSSIGCEGEACTALNHGVVVFVVVVYTRSRDTLDTANQVALLNCCSNTHENVTLAE